MSRYASNIKRYVNEDIEQSKPVYVEVRKALAPQYQHLSNREIEQLFRHQFGDAISPADIEFSLGDFGKALGQVAGAVLPVAGTVVGTAFGGPIGGAVGGALGSVAGGAISSATQPAPRPPAPRPPAPRPPAPVQPSRPFIGGFLSPPQLQQLGASRPTAAPSQPMTTPPVPTAIGMRSPGVTPSAPAPVPTQTPVAGTASTPAAAQLLSALVTPQMLQALIALLLGQIGQNSVLVGNSEVPVGAFANLLGVLANQAATEHNASTYNAGEDVPGYLMDAYGEFVVDPAVPEQRAALLLEMLQQANARPIPSSARPINRTAHIRAAEMSLENMYDAIELSELYEDIEDFEDTEDFEDFEDMEWED